AAARRARLRSVPGVLLQPRPRPRKVRGAAARGSASDRGGCSSNPQQACRLEKLKRPGGTAKVKPPAKGSLTDGQPALRRRTGGAEGRRPNAKHQLWAGTAKSLTHRRRSAYIAAMLAPPKAPQVT